MPPREAPPVDEAPGIVAPDPDAHSVPASPTRPAPSKPAPPSPPVAARATNQRVSSAEPDAAATAPPPEPPSAPKHTAPAPEAPGSQAPPTPGGPALLRVLAEEAAACRACALHEGRSQSVFARGDGSSGLVFVGEGPGEEEDRQGLPFVGPAGQLLDRMIEAMGVERSAVYVCNIVKCRPPRNRKPDAAEMAACASLLERQLAAVAPRVIVALGATAVQGLLGTSEGITRMRGRWRLYRGRIPVMPTFHPAYLLRQPRAKRDVWADLQQVMGHLKA